MKKKKTKAKISTQSKIGMTIISSVIIIMTLLMTIQTFKIKGKIRQIELHNIEISDLIQEEKDRREYIKTLPELMYERDNVEKIARNKIGLVYSDEVVFKPTN